MDWHPQSRISNVRSRNECVTRFGVLLITLLTMAGLTAGQQPSGGLVSSGEIRTLPSHDADRIQQGAARNPNQPSNPKQATDDTCLLPPLNVASTSAVSTHQLQISAKARKEYQQACGALHSQKLLEAEKHLRKALEIEPKYAAAWVTLGQLQVAAQKNDEGRQACAKAAEADNRYVPAQLCLADIAVRNHAWDEALRYSSRAIELDPSGDVVAYEYHAAANLNLRHLPEAEKSALRAVEIDKEHREPRAYFVLAQVYEAKQDATNEAAALREYLKYASDPRDIAGVKGYLAELEKQK